MKKSISAGTSIGELIPPGKALTVEAGDDTALCHVCLIGRDGVTLANTAIFSAPDQPKQFGPYFTAQAIRIDAITGSISYTINWATREAAVSAWLSGAERRL